MEIPAKTVVGQVIPANQVPLVVHPTRTAGETINKASKGWVLEALDLQSLKEWPESEQKWSFGPGPHAGSYVWQVLLALYGCTGKGAHREVSPMFSFQSQTAKSTSWKHHGHSSSGAGPPWLSMPGTWEGPRRKCSGDHRPFNQVCSGVCNKDSNHTNDCKDPMGQIYCPLWATQKDSYWLGMKFWESVGGWPLWVDGGVEDLD